MPVVTFVTYPSRENEQQSKYAFPYYQAEFGVFEAHGIYDVSRTHSLASHGYIVAVINYGDERIRAGVIAAPWVGGHYDGSDFFAFGFNNSALTQVDAPMLCLFGTNDEDALASFILPAIRQLSGPTCVVELVGYCDLRIFASGPTLFSAATSLLE